MKIKKFTFNPFSENTYLIYEGGNGIVIDPGMSQPVEEEEFHQFVLENKIGITRNILTHCHIDHVLGNDFIKRKYNVLPEFHEMDRMLFDNNDKVASMYGIPYTPSPEPKCYLHQDDTINIGDSTLEIRFVPGHAPGHLVFIHHEDKLVIAGDTLFRQSIGRTDLPGGNHEQLLASIRKELFTLGNDYTVYCGHGPETTIGFEKENNPFVGQA